MAVNEVREMLVLDQTGSKSRRAWLGKAGAVAQGALVTGFLVGGGLWAVSLDRSGLQEPEAAREPASPPLLSIDTQGSAWHSTFIVGSEEEAATLRRALEEGNNVRHSLGLDPMRDEVLVAVTPAEALHMERALLEGNLILASFGVETRVHNLAN